MSPEPDYSALDPGIRELVRVLRAAGFDTTDSGDGSKATWQEGALPFRHVVAQVEPGRLIVEAHRLMAVAAQAGYAPGWRVEASYSPWDGVALLVLAESA